MNGPRATNCSCEGFSNALPSLFFPSVCLGDVVLQDLTLNLFAGIGGAVDSSLFPTPGMLTLNQAQYFAPSTFSGINQSAFGQNEGQVLQSHNR